MLTPRPPADMFSRLAAAAIRRPVRTAAAWLVLAVTLTAVVPSLERVTSHQSAAYLPASSPTMHGLRVMDQAFGTGRAKSFMFIVLEDTHGLSTADEASYRALVARLRTDPHVVELQDYVSEPRLRGVFTSRDKDATYLPLALPDAVGSPAAIRDVQHIDRVVTAIPTARGTHTYVTGDPAMVADLNEAVSHASLRVGIISLVLLIIILLSIYRRLLTPLVPLATIAVALITTRGLVSLLAEHGMAVSSYSGTLLSAIVLGAGTDYCVFLISRFQEELRKGASVADAVQLSGARVGRVVAASAATVVLGSLCMALTKLSLFAATGPALAVAVAVTAVTALTLTPALLRVGGQRFASRKAATGPGGWLRVGDLVATRPVRVLLAGSLLLLAMASFFPTVRLSFDQRALQPASSPSNIANHVLSRHFPANETLPDYLLVVSDHDMSNPADLATLDSLTLALTRVPGVVAVRSITNPTGSRLSSPSPAAVDRSQSALARQLFLSRDGRVARVQITGASDPLSASGLHRAAEIRRAAELTLRGTSLTHASVLATGASGLGTDLRNYLAADARFVVIAVLMSVLLILIVALRALIAPLYLLASVILSYAAAMGLTTLVWQHLLGHPIDFTVPVFGFVILVAVGADYNIFLMSRLREEAANVTPASITRAVAATGGVITSAGVIFASTFAAVTSSPLISLAENGFAVATGLLLDTFIVRSMLVPSTAALLRDFNWWPRKPRPILPRRDQQAAIRPAEEALARRF